MSFAKNLLSDRFFRNNLVFFVGTLIVGALNYAFHPILGRMMSASDYGEVQALLALVVQVGVFQGMFGIVIINIVANGGNDEDKLAVISEIRKVALYSAAVLFIALLVSTVFFKNFLQFDSVWPFFGVAAMVPLSVAITVRSSFLRGRQRFADISVNGILQSGGKLLFAVVLVFIGWKAFGAITGILLAQALSLWHLYDKTKDQLAFEPFHKTKLTKKISKELVYGIIVLITTSAITFLYSGDVLVVKHFFSPDDAGLYSGVSIVARAIYFLVGPITGVLFASAAISNTRKENTVLLLKSLVIVCAIGGSAAAAFALAPSFVTNLLLGQKYLTYAWLLPKLSLSLFITSVVSLFFMYYLALREYFVVLLALGGVTAIAVLSYFRHADLSSVVSNFIYCGSAILAVFILSFVINGLMSISKQRHCHPHENGEPAELSPLSSP
jgi:O-antigen/teichoic acid export membrane protein